MYQTLSILAVLACAASACAAGPLEGIEPAKRPRLKSIYGNVHELREFVGPRDRGLVLVFLGTDCPVARQYLPTLNQLSGEYSLQGIRFLGIYADAGVNAFKMATHAHDCDLSFAVLQDTEHRLADLLQAQVTPEVVVLDAHLEKQYQGAIDDQYARHGRKPEASEHYLRDALRSLVAGRPIKPDYVAASGCAIQRQEPRRTPREVTYYKDIAPLVQKNCQTCHRKGGPGPFELRTYDDVALHTGTIREVVNDRRMPPWHGILNPEFGTLLNDKRLSEEEIATLLAWIDGGATEGKAADAPPPVRWPAADEWSIGKPDYVYRLAEPFQVPKSGTLEYQFLRVKMDLPEDRWFRAIEIKPGNPEVVHHISLHLAPATSNKNYSGLAAMVQLYGLNGELTRAINDFVPGDTYNAKSYPPDQAVLIPKHHDLIFEVHYTPNGRAAAQDQSMAAFQWASGPPKEQVLTTIYRVSIGGFRIPPGEPRFRLEDTYFFKHDVLIDAIRPHFHLRGKSFRLEWIERDPASDEIVRRRTILSVPIFDPAWQRTYELATPLALPAGAELLATAYFDNSKLNPNNPDPTAEVIWGQQTTDEMFSTRFKYRLAK